MSPIFGRIWVRTACLVWICGLCGTLLAQDAPSNTPSAANTEQSPETEAQIAHWIEQLGDSQYPMRERAQQELRRLGTAAFDQLLAAQDHQDVEIAQRARYLVRSIPVQWTLPSDPAVVRSFLVNFGELGRNERRTRAQHLATLDEQVWIEPLCRIVRFESDRILSKHAALLIMSRPVSEDAELRQQRADRIRLAIAHSNRPAMEWLQTYCRELEEPLSTLPDWDRITRTELVTLAKNPQQSDRAVARDLVRWQTKLLLSRERRDEALVNFRRTYDLIDDQITDIYEVIDWAIENELYSAPSEIAGRFQTRIQGDPRLLYRLAEAQAKAGNQAAADATAADARRLNPTKYDDHLATAELLYRRGLIDWAASEYRLVLDSGLNIDSEQALEARDHLSRMLVDAGREKEAADVVQPLLDFAAKEEKPNDITQMINSYFRGNMHYWRGLYFAKVGDRVKQMEHLSRAIEASPTNIDILIAMFRLSDPDPKWEQDVQERIDAHLGKCRSQITKFEEMIRRQPNFEAAASEQLATAYNELAWLISNTTGDAQEAVRASQRSLELSPNNEAYLDTLGRCYFAAGDLEQAIHHQRRAVAIAPHLLVMQRQLKTFEDALAETQANRGPDAKTAKQK